MNERIHQDLFYIVENSLIKKDCALVLDDGRVISCISSKYMYKDCPVRVHAKSGDIEINWDVYKKASAEFRFWILCWSIYRYEVQSETDADICATKMYSNNFSIKKLLPEYIQLLSKSPSDFNRERLKNLQNRFYKR